MKYIIINNYTLGAKLKSCPLEKIVSKERIDSRHTKVIFDNLTSNDIHLIEKACAKKLINIDSLNIENK